MGPRRLRNCFSRRNNRFHRLVRGEFPAHADREGIETAGEARPEDDAVRRRITRCHAERERVRIETDLAIGGAGWKRLRNTKRCENLQEPAAADHGERISGPCFRVPTRLASYMRLRLLANSNGDSCARRAPSCGWKALLPACEGARMCRRLPAAGCTGRAGRARRCYISAPPGMRRS